MRLIKYGYLPRFLVNTLSRQYLVLRFKFYEIDCILYEASALKPPFTVNSMDGLYINNFSFYCNKAT